MTSPFLSSSSETWITANDTAFAIFDNFPVTPGHVLVVTRRLVPTWFDATQAEQAAVMLLVNEVKSILDELLKPEPDGYNVGFNAGEAAGQTVPHLHIHVIPRYKGDVSDPRGGIRHVIPGKGNYLAGDISSAPASFHPKAWQISDESTGLIVVGSSNLSRPALQTGVEWNLLSERQAAPEAHDKVRLQFSSLWDGR